MSAKPKVYVYTIVAGGGTVLAGALWHASSPDPIHCFIYMVLAVLASTVKLKLPGITGTYSLNFLLLLAGIQRFTLAETLVAGCAAALVQCLWRAKNRPAVEQILFNMANLILSVAVAFGLARRVLPAAGMAAPASLALVAFVYFVVNTGLVSGLLAMLKNEPLRHTWEQWYEWSLPYYLVGALLVGLAPTPGHAPALEPWLLMLPLLYMIYFFHRLAAGARARTAATVAQAGKPAGLPPRAKVWIAAVIAAGFGVAALAAWRLNPAMPGRFQVYLAAAALASMLKIRLPGVVGTLSLGFVLTLAAIVDLGFSEAVMVGGVAALVQCLWGAKQKPKAVQVSYSMAAMVLSTALAFVVCRLAFRGIPGHSTMGVTLLATVPLYGSNTVLISAVLGLVERKPLHRILRACYFWSFPYYLVGAAAVSVMLGSGSQTIGWAPALLVLPITILVYVSYRLHVERAAVAC